MDAPTKFNVEVKKTGTPDPLWHFFESFGSKADAETLLALKVTEYPHLEFRVIEEAPVGDISAAIEMAYNHGYKPGPALVDEYNEMVHLLGREPTSDEAFILCEARKKGFKKRMIEKLAIRFGG